MPHPHAMIDLETMGLNLCKAPILQIGCTLFYPRRPGIKAAWSTRISMDSNLECGRVEEKETREKFWDKQPPELLEKLLSGTDHLTSAMGSLAGFLLQHDVGEVWSNGSTFDIAMLAIAYEDLKVGLPWDFRLVRDTRTIWALAADRYPPFLKHTEQLQKILGWQRYEGDDVRHDALSDCLRQTLMVQMAYAITDMDRAELQRVSL